MPISLSLEFYPLTKERWGDLEMLFGQRGACGGCWCMSWRLKRSQFLQQKGEANKEALKRIVESGEIPGILAYVNGDPVAWCSVGPREVFPRLGRSQVLRPVDDRQVWSVVCFFVAKSFRNKGVTSELLKNVVEYVRKRGGGIVEGYPTEPSQGKILDAFAYTGLTSAFRKAGFVEVMRRSRSRPIVRYMIHGE